MSGVLSLFKKDSLTKRLERIRTGDATEREKLIEDYIPFIIKTVSNKINKYIESQNSEEFSIGLHAFNEAIDKYDISKGGFLNFAKLVIESRLIDYMRKLNKTKRVVLLSQIEDEQKYRLQECYSIDDFTEAVALKSEIKEFETELMKFNITFGDLVEQSPKHIDTRTKAINIAKYIAANKEIKQELFEKKKIPMSVLVEELNVTPKVLRRSKKFIIAIVIILDSNLDLLKNYVTCIKGGVMNDL